MCLFLTDPCLAAGSGWLGWFSPALREARSRIDASREALRAMGSPAIGNTVAQFGYQHLQMQVPPPESPWIQVDLGSPQSLDLVALVPALVDFQSLDRRAYGFPRRFRVDVSDDPAFQSFRPLLVHTEEDFPDPGPAPVLIRGDGGTARYIRLTVTRLAEENDTHFFAMAELMALQGNRNLALHTAVSSTNSVTIPPRWNLQFLVDGRTPLGPPIRPVPLPEYDALFAALPPQGGPAWMGVDLEKTGEVTEVRLHPLHARQGADVPGFRFPLRFRVEVSSEPDFQNAQVFADSGEADYPNPGNNPVTLRRPALQGRYVRVAALKLSAPEVPDFALSELQVYQGDRLISSGKPGLSSGDPQRSRPLSLLTDGSTSFGRLMEWPAWLEEWDRHRQEQLRLAAALGQLPPLESAARRRAVATAAGLGVLLATGVLLGMRRSRRLQQAELTEFRNRLACDLHDEIGSNLAGIAIISGTASRGTGSHAEDWAEVERIARESSDAMREVLWLAGARQEMGLDLLPQLQRAAERLLGGYKVSWTTLPGPLPESWPVEARRQVFLFFKEALTNVVRHARASEVRLSAKVAAGQFELSVEDNGCGFDPAAVSRGMGLGSLRNRARQLGGRVLFDSRPGLGTKIVLRVPIPAA